MRALSVREVRGRLRALGLSPRKALGQHFLVDRGVLGRVVEAADLSPWDTVVEVGPGLGILTEAWAERAGRVIALEIDEALASALGRALSAYPTVRVVPGDARKVDPCGLVPVGSRYKVVANLPYYAALPILRRFLESPCRPVLLVVMLQKEVAQQMTAAPGEMSLLSVAVQFYGRPRRVATVPPKAFFPPPKVTSAVVRIDVWPERPLRADPQGFFALARAGFSAPRKQLAQVFAARWGVARDQVEVLLRRAGVEPLWRAERLSLEQWGALYEVWRAWKTGEGAGLRQG